MSALQLWITWSAGWFVWLSGAGTHIPCQHCNRDRVQVTASCQTWRRLVTHVAAPNRPPALQLCSPADWLTHQDIPDRRWESLADARPPMFNNLPTQGDAQLPDRPLRASHAQQADIHNWMCLPAVCRHATHRPGGGRTGVYPPQVLQQS